MKFVHRVHQQTERQTNRQTQNEYKITHRRFKSNLDYKYKIMQTKNNNIRYADHYACSVQLSFELYIQYMDWTEHFEPTTVRTITSRRYVCPCSCTTISFDLVCNL